MSLEIMNAAVMQKPGSSFAAKEELLKCIALCSNACLQDVQSTVAINHAIHAAIMPE